MEGSVQRSVFVFWLAALMAMSGASDPVTVLAQDSSSASAVLEMPTTGAARAGPIVPTVALVVRPCAVRPIQIRIDEAGVDAPTEQESLTLITCGGPFDAETGEYLERMVVRAVRTR